MLTDSNLLIAPNILKGLFTYQFWIFWELSDFYRKTSCLLVSSRVPMNFHINTYLNPLVDELQQLWHGKSMKTHNGNDVWLCMYREPSYMYVLHQIYICTSSKKNMWICWTQCIVRVLKVSSYFPCEEVRWTGRLFNQADWKAHTGVSHRSNALSHHNCRTKSEQYAIKRSTV